MRTGVFRSGGVRGVPRRQCDDRSVNWTPVSTGVVVWTGIQEAISVLKGIADQGCRGTDVTLLQRVIAKESEGRMALAALLWTDSGNSDSKQQAETNLGEACIRLEQLQADAAGRQDVVRTDPIAPLPYSIDDVHPSTCRAASSEYSLLNDLNGPIVSKEGRSLQNVAIVHQTVTSVR
jgi:hypothetical protein